MENQTDTKETEMPQEPKIIDNVNNNLLANMFNSFLTKADQKVPQDEEEDSDDEEEEDSDEEDSDDDKWVALQKLLDSHLRITKCLLHMIKEK